jgi:uncharacterized protein
MMFILIIGFMLLSWLIGSKLKNKFKEYSMIPNSAGMSGKEIAEKMLKDNGIYDVNVISVQGHLSDHYNPSDKTVNLSPEVYQGRSVAAAAVSAHEVGHAVQHAHAYTWLQMRSTLVPVVSFASKYMMWVLLGGVIVLSYFPENPQLLLAGIILFATTTLFSFITLPVEFDASRRALVWINSVGITRGQENTQAKDALKWAAMTYVVAALASLATLAHYIMIYMGSSRR